MGKPKHALHRNGVRLRGAHRHIERAGGMRGIAASPIVAAVTPDSWCDVIEYVLYLLCLEFFLAQRICCASRA